MQWRFCDITGFKQILIDQVQRKPQCCLNTLEFMLWRALRNTWINKMLHLWLSQKAKTQHTQTFNEGGSREERAGLEVLEWNL